MASATTSLGIRRDLFDDEHDEYRASFRAFLKAEVVPNHERWKENHLVDRDLFTKAAEHGFVAMAVPEEYGGAGIDDWRFNAVLAEESAHAGCAVLVDGPERRQRPRPAVPARPGQRGAAPALVPRHRQRRARSSRSR